MPHNNDPYNFSSFSGDDDPAWWRKQLLEKLEKNREAVTGDQWWKLYEEFRPLPPPNPLLKKLREIWGEDSFIPGILVTEILTPLADPRSNIRVDTEWQVVSKEESYKHQRRVYFGSRDFELYEKEVFNAAMDYDERTEPLRKKLRDQELGLDHDKQTYKDYLSGMSPEAKAILGPEPPSPFKESSSGMAQSCMNLKPMQQRMEELKKYKESIELHHPEKCVGLFPLCVDDMINGIEKRGNDDY